MYNCFCVYARHAGFVREVPKDSERDFNQISNPAVNTYIHTLQDYGVPGSIQNGNMSLSGFLFEKLL